MSDRLEKYLDGELDADALSADERAQAKALKDVIETTRAFVESATEPDLRIRIMAQVEPAHQQPSAMGWRTFRRLLESVWVRREVSFRFRPVHGLLLVGAVVVALVLWPPRTRSEVGVEPSGQAASDVRIFVQFRLEAPQASRVSLAGSFTQWQPRYELHQATPGIWTITIPLSTGVHDYVFVIDGQRWVSDPYAQHVSDRFGATNSRIALIAPESPRS